MSKTGKYSFDNTAELGFVPSVMPNSKTVCIGIGGGVGPAAGVILHRKIIEATVSDGTDQSHCEVHHISRPGVADRTNYLIGESNESPAVGMARTMAALAESAQASGKITAVAGVPCNTFHAPKIWEEFIQILSDEGTSTTVKMVHMLEETVAAIKQVVPTAKKIGLLSTTGTRNSRVYHDLLEPQGFTVIQVDSNLQSMVHDAIYNRDWGVKAVQPTTPEARAAFLMFAEEVAQQGADAIILGCTEIPLALPECAYGDIPLIDPMAVLSRALVTKAGALASDFVVSPGTSPMSPMLSPCSFSPFSPPLSPTVASPRSTPANWHRHAAAFVIQAHWKAYRNSRATGECLQEFFRNTYGASIESEGPDAVTPEMFTPNVASGMLRISSSDVLMT